MEQSSKIWTLDDFSLAMEVAVKSHCDHRILRAEKGKVLFNGFWRNGDKQNLCLWLDKATWHDAKTGDGGGCKEFAKIAFNMSLPDFMHRYGTSPVQISQPISIKDAFNRPQKLTKAVDEIWLGLQKNDRNRPDLAAEWLKNKRGFDSPRQLIGSGFVNLGLEDIELFEQQHHKLIQQRLALGPQIVAPLRGVNSDQVQNLFFRSISECSKEEKSRLLTGAGGWSESDGSPRAFGLPHLIGDFSHLILCEGMADYFAVECLLDANEQYLPIGTANASALIKWAQYLVRIKYSGRLTIVYQLDSSDGEHLSSKEIGPSKAIQAIRILRDSAIKVELFNWLAFIENTTTHPSKINDIADSVTQEYLNRECGPYHLNNFFLLCLEQRELF